VLATAKWGITSLTYTVAYTKNVVGKNAAKNKTGKNILYPQVRMAKPKIMAATAPVMPTTVENVVEGGILFEVYDHESQGRAVLKQSGLVAFPFKQRLYVAHHPQPTAYLHCSALRALSHLHCGGTMLLKSLASFC